MPSSTPPRPAGRRRRNPVCMTASRRDRSPGWSISNEPPVRDAPLPPAAAAAVQRPAGTARPQERPAVRRGARQAQTDWVTPANFTTSAAPAFPRQGRPHCGAGPHQPCRSRQPSSTCTAIISGCSTGSTTAGSRSGWIRWRSSPDRPNASPSPPNIAGRWLLESVGTDWTAPRLVRWYSVG